MDPVKQSKTNIFRLRKQTFFVTLESPCVCQEGRRKEEQTHFRITRHGIFSSCYSFLDVICIKLHKHVSQKQSEIVFRVKSQVLLLHKKLSTSFRSFFRYAFNVESLSCE